MKITKIKPYNENEGKKAAKRWSIKAKKKTNLNNNN